MENSDSGEIKIPKESSISYLPQVIEVKNVTQTPREYIKENFNDVEDFEIENKMKIFKLEDGILDRPLTKLSSGQKTKIALIRILLSKEDFIILDEPTNNLDIETLLWLENFIKKSNSSFIIVSHDRYLIEKIKPNKIYEVPKDKLVFITDYNDYLENLKNNILK